MRILAVRGENLASLEHPFELNFQQEPLASAGLFVISGPTGSGKSTILDAICLALYNETPRLMNVADRSNKVQDVAGEMLSAVDPRQVLRRGATAGYAEVDFEGVDGKQYRARWAVRRANNRQTSRLLPSEMRLQSLSDHSNIESQKRECLAQIQRLVGLSYDQFTRAVLLAQGEFSRFLRAKESEKADLLERLTGTERFSLISRYIHERAVALRREQEVLLAEMTRLQAQRLSPEELLEKRDRLATTRKSREDTLKTQHNLKQLQTWRKRRDQLAEDLKQASEGLLHAQKALSEAEQYTELTVRWDAAQAIEERYSEWQRTTEELISLRKTIADQQVRIENQQKSCATLLEALSQAQKELEAYQEESGRVQATLNKARAEQARFDERSKALQLQRDEAKAIQHDLLHTQNSLAQTAKNYDALCAKRANTIRSIEGRLAKLGMSIDQISQVDLYCEWLMTHLQSTRLLERARIDDASSIKASEELSQRKKILEEQLIQLDATLPLEALKLREQLQDGVACPVCGSTRHPISSAEAHPALDLAQLQQTREENQKAQKELLAQAQALSLKMGETQATLKRESEQQRILAAKLDDLFGRDINWRTRLQQENRIQNFKDYTLAIIKDQNNLTNIKQNEYQEKYNQDQLIIQLEELKSKRALAEKRLQVLEEDVKCLSKNLSEWLEGKSIEEVEQSIRLRARTLQDKLEKMRNAYTQSVSQLESLRGGLTNYVEREQLLAQRNDHCEKEVNEWILKSDLFEDIERLKSILSHKSETISTYRQRIQQCREELSRAITLDQSAQKALQVHLEDTEDDPALDITGLETRIQETKSALEQYEKDIQELEYAVRVDEDLAIALRKQEELRLPLEKKLLLWSELKEMFGSHDGAKFRVIAQSYTLDLLLHYANEHLEQIMPRYRLRRPKDLRGNTMGLSLEIVDNEMLDEVRAADTLSGGETFMVSLALSLSLSSLSSHATQMDSLFIDEGFGALDPISLGIVLDALERLQMHGRKVGLISHVQELNERIPVQVCVDKGPGGRSRVRVKG